MKSKFTANNLAAGLLDQVTRECFALSQEAAEQTCQEILEDAASRAPVRTGTLRKSKRTYKGRTPGSKGAKFRNYNEIKMAFGVRRRRRKSGKRDRGRADYAAIVHNDPNLKLRRGEHQFLYKAVARRQHRLRALTHQKWRAR